MTRRRTWQGNEPAARVRLRQSTILIIALIGGWTTIASLYRDDLYDGFAVLSSIGILVASIAFFKWDPPSGRDSFRVVAFFVCIQTFLTSGVSVISEVPDSPAGTPHGVSALSFSVHAAVIFSLMFVAGVWVSAPKEQECLSDPVGPNTGPRPGVAVAIALAAVLVNISFAVSTVESQVGRLGALPLVIFNMSLLAPMFLAARVINPSFPIWPAAIVLLGQAAITFYNSMLGIVVLTLRDMALAQVYLKGKVPARMMLAAAAIVLVLNPAKMEFRNKAGERAAGTADAAELSATWEQAIENAWSPHNTASGSRIEGTLDRLNYNTVIAHVYTVVPSRVPFQLGRTFEDIPTVLIPRVLYPDKPTSEGYTRSRWLMLIGIQDSRTIQTSAVALPASAEAYWNFGWPGLFTVPVILGFFVGLTLRLAPRDPVARTAYVVLVATSLGNFLDMLVWLIPQFVTVLVGAALASIYCRLGRRRSVANRNVLARASGG